jgi:hypothetical protein
MEQLVSKSKRLKLEKPRLISFPRIGPNDLTGIPMLFDEALDQQMRYAVGVTKEMVLDLLCERKGDK